MQRDFFLALLRGGNQAHTLVQMEGRCKQVVHLLSDALVMEMLNVNDGSIIRK